jgi:RNA polymerase sigma-70 factor (ECF subfamily)
VLEKERALIDQILRGNLNTFRDLVEKYQKLVAHIVFRLVSHRDDREEICHEVFIKVYQNLAGFKFRSKLSTWIGRIAYTTTINYLRKEKVPLYEDIKPANQADDDIEYYGSDIKSIQSEEPTPAEALELYDQKVLIQKQLEKLPALYRTILTLYHLEQMSYQEIGTIMELPEGTVKSYLFRARKKLKDILVMELEGETL